MMETNFYSVVVLTREVVKGMMARNRWGRTRARGAAALGRGQGELSPQLVHGSHRRPPPRPCPPPSMHCPS
jgi:hypothetical protein